MTLSAIISRCPSELSFDVLPDVRVPYQRQIPPACLPFICLNVTDDLSGDKMRVFIQEGALRNIGLSVTALKAAQLNRPEDIPRLLRNVSITKNLLQRAAPIAATQLDPQHLPFFAGNISFGTRFINLHLEQFTQHISGVPEAPDLYFTRHQIFIDSNGLNPKLGVIGSGTFGDVNKSIWLTAPKQNEMVVAKKVVKTNCPDKTQLKTEIAALKEFHSKRGVISMISGGDFDGKLALFMPLYECEIANCSFSLDKGQLLSVFSQLIEGLCAISKKGTHGDLSGRNILLRRDSQNNVEAVISDFGSFRSHGEEEYGLSTPNYVSPEYCKMKHVSPAQDVWALGLILYKFCSPGELPNSDLSLPEMTEWTSELEPGWVLKYPTYPGLPLFLVQLMNDMLDPRKNCRPTAEAICERFSKELVRCVEESYAALNENHPKRKKLEQDQKV